MEISISKINHIRAALSYASPTTSPPTPTHPDPLAYGFFTPPPPTGFPLTHLAHPTHLLDGLSDEMINSCLLDPTPKIIARLFNLLKAQDPSDPDLPGAVLTLVINSIITQTNPLAPPARLLLTTRLPYSDQTCSIIALPSETIQEILLERRIWSSSFITFEAFPFTIPPPPTLILALSGFASGDQKLPLNLIHLVWNLPYNAKRITSALDLESDVQDDEKLLIESLLASSWVEAYVNEPLPGFNFVIHASPPYREAAQWAKLKLTLFSLDYDSHHGMGQIRAIPIPSCSLCHSASHPTPSCPFPKLPCWNGPKQPLQIDPGPRV